MAADQQIILITGANQGLGYLAALQLSKRSDVHVLVGARNIAKGEDAVKSILAASAQGSVSPISIDVSLDESVAAAALEVKNKFGRLDVLIVFYILLPAQQELTDNIHHIEQCWC